MGSRRESFSSSPLPMSLDDVSINGPITRSLSKSTPRDPSIKHPPPARAQVKDRAEDDISVQPPAQTLDQGPDHSDEPTILPVDHTKESSCSPIEKLPTEILEAVINYVGGHLGSAGFSKSDASRNWNAILRHPRRKNISNLALVSSAWRRLVQERIFRHSRITSCTYTSHADGVVVKVQGTQGALTQCGDFFLNHSHLQSYVRHFQVIVPIWETKRSAMCQRHLQDLGNVESTGSIIRGTYGYPVSQGILNDQQAEISQIFQPASHNAALSEIFGSAQVLFPELHALTIEGGHCKRPPQIKYFPSQPGNPFMLSEPWSLRCSRPGSTFLGNSPSEPYLPTLSSLKVLILKGAWNIVRQPSDLNVFYRALPNLQELHCTYHAPKTDAYSTMSETLRTNTFPHTVRHLNICLEGLYAKNPSSLVKWRKLYPTYHICRDIGGIVPQLESIAYTGRLCGALFSSAIKAAEQTRVGTARLKRVDIIVQNVCRDANANNDGTGIHNWPFIQAFEMLIVQAMRALAVYQDVKCMRIRFIDLDSPDPLLNPTFHLEGDKAWGFWSTEILSLLQAARPEVRFEASQYGAAYKDADSGIARRSHSVEDYSAMAQGLGRVLL